MRQRYKQVIEALQRTQDFKREHPLPPPLEYGAPGALIDEVVAALTGHTTTQVSGGRKTKEEMQREEVFKAALRELHLRPISLVARASLRQSPGIDKALRMPRPQLSTTKLIAEAKGIREAVTPHESAFVANGRPADFLPQLDAAIQQLQDAMLGKARNLGRRVGAGEGIAETLSIGADAVKLLDAMVSTAFAGNGDVLARWRMAKRVRRSPTGVAVRATGGTADENLEPKAA